MIIENTALFIEALHKTNLNLNWSTQYDHFYPRDPSYHLRLFLEIEIPVRVKTEIQTIYHTHTLEKYIGSLYTPALVWFNIPTLRSILKITLDGALYVGAPGQHITVKRDSMLSSERLEQIERCNMYSRQRHMFNFYRTRNILIIPSLSTVWAFV